MWRLRFDAWGTCPPGPGTSQQASSRPPQRYVCRAPLSACMHFLPTKLTPHPSTPPCQAASGHAAAPPSGSGRNTGGAQPAVAQSPAGGRISADTVIAHGPSVVHFEPGSFSSAQRAPPLRLAGAALMPEAVPVQPAARRTKHKGALLGCLCRNSGKGKVMSQ